MSEELKPCPFCRSTDVRATERTCDKSSPYNPDDRAFPIVRCGNCFCSVPGKDWTDVATAITAWNTRAAQQPAAPTVPVPRITTPDVMGVLRRVATSDVLSDRSGVMFIDLAVDRDVWDEIAYLLAASGNDASNKKGGA